MSDHGGVNQALGQAYFLDLLGDAYNGLGRYEEAIVALSEAAASFAEHQPGGSVPGGMPADLP
jgi:hypothetical protein